MRDNLIRFADMLSGLLRRTSSPMASLDRSISAAGQAHVSARRALAIAIAEETRETERRAALAAKVCDLEQRAVHAIRAGRDDLAVQVSEAIASLSTEIDASQRASVRFAAEVALARREVDAQRRRLAELDRGRRFAKIGQALTTSLLVRTPVLILSPTPKPRSPRSMPTIAMPVRCATRWRRPPNA